MPLEDLGWDETRAREIEPWAGKAGFQPGRVIIGFNYLYRVGVEEGEVEAVLAGRLKHRAESRVSCPPLVIGSSFANSRTKIEAPSWPCSRDEAASRAAWPAT